jgi:hypothetical protein
LSKRSFSTNFATLLAAAFGRIKEVLKTSFVDKTTFTSGTTINSFSAT